MEAMDIVRGLAGFPNRGAGTDAERRAALWLADQLAGDGHEVTVETFWCRPNWALAQAVHAALAVAGGLLALTSPVAGVAVLGLTLASVIADWLTGRSLGRALTTEHASQNVMLGLPPKQPEDGRTVRLILTANYDAGRTGLVYRDWLRRPTAAARRALAGLAPGWLAWLTLGVAWLLAIAALRLARHTSHLIGLLQLPPTVGLLIAFALLLELAVASSSPAAGDNGTGVGVAIALARALTTVPPKHLSVELLLTGAGDGDGVGLRRHLSSGRGQRRLSDTIVLGLAPCASGAPRWWNSDGPLLPLRYGRPLRELAQQIAVDEPHLDARAITGRGRTPALTARMAGIPAITIGCLDAPGLALRSHQRADTAAAVDANALDRALQFGLLMLDAIDAAVGGLRERRATTPA